MAAIAAAPYNHAASPYTSRNHPTTSTPTTTAQEVMQDPQVPDDQQYNTSFCRALYDYEAQDPSALSFRRDDIIEILTRQPSGWWDGLLGEERGWFPSNYVVIISDEEAEAAFTQAEGEAPDSAIATATPIQQEDAPVDLSQAMSRGAQVENEEWLDNEVSFRAGNQETQPPVVNKNGGQSGDFWMPKVTADGQIYYENTQTGQVSLYLPQESEDVGIGNQETQPPVVNKNGGQSSDFWMPKVTADGQIYYENTQTGQVSRYLPQEAEDDVSDGDLAGLASQSTSRSGTSAFGYIDPAEASSESENEARRNNSERWIKKLADDGISYYYLNTMDGRVQWTAPESGSVTGAPSTRTAKSAAQPDSSRLSVYSDDSDIQPFDHLPKARSRGNTGASRTLASSARSDHVQPTVMELTSAERIAKQLQESLEPPPPKVVSDLSTIARDSIKAVVENIHSSGVVRQPEEDRKMDELVYEAVLAVRNLLYIAGAPSASSSLPDGSRDAKSHSSSQLTLKPAQRKVTATLSRLVLSARAMQYDSGSTLTDTLIRIETDSEELERAVIAFVLEAQRNERHQAHQQPKEHPKRLHGVFTTTNIGLGLVGGGSSGSWKGFGYVAPDNEVEMPSKALGTEVISEIGVALGQLQESFNALGQALRTTTDNSVELVRTRVQELVSQISSFLSLIADIHVARHVDIDGIRQAEGAVVSDHYSVSVENARRLVRTLESSVQAVYDDSSALLLTAQALHESGDQTFVQRGEREAQYDFLDSLSTSLSGNLNLVKQTFEGLLSVGHEQADVAQGDYNGSIDWRMSRISAINDHLNAMNITPLKPLDAYGSENEDVVDMELAFNRPGLRKQQSSAADASFDSYRTLTNADPMSLPSIKDSEASADDTLVPQSPLDPRGGDNYIDDGERSLFDEDVVPTKPTRQPTGSNKLQRLLGDEYADKVAADLQPWYLRPNYSPSDIVIEPDGSVRGGTVSALVERLTAHEQVDPTFTKAFLMTYKAFTTLDELFDLLVARFRIQPPDNLNPQEREEWGKLKQHVIQMRVLNTFKTMIIDEGVLEKEDDFIFDRMKEFLSLDEVSKFAAAKQLLILIERTRGQGDVKMLVNTQTSPPPPPLMPKSSKKLKLLDIDPLELARQLTILESGLYQKIKPLECLNRSREQRTESTDNISNSIQTSNRIADWVADSILSKEDSRRRAQVIKHLIMIADRCRGLNNFSTMAAIISGLNTPPIRRLKRTWEQVNQRFMSQFEACNNVIDSNKNFTKYKQVLASAAPPCVPFIGPFLTNLEFIQVGNKDMLPGGLINFRKRQKTSEVINDVKRWQSQAYNLQPIPSVQAYIADSLNQFNDTKASSDHFWAISLEREPREREDERMARLLQESGFL